jgi:hypothetical protein
LFLLYKICHFEDGITEIIPFVSDLIDYALMALIKSENNELRTNCIGMHAFTNIRRNTAYTVMYKQRE